MNENPIYPINPKTQKHLNKIKDSLPQSILLFGQPGVGLEVIAKYLAKKPHAIIKPIVEKGQKKSEIRVNQIREIYKLTRGKSKTEQVIILENTESMNIAAQNAFLKLLEEPPKNTKFILTTSDISALLSTIRSRVQTINVLPITKIQTTEFLKSLNIEDKDTLNKIVFLASGLPAEIYKLTNDHKYFEQLAEIVVDAKSILIENKDSKIKIAQKYNKQYNRGLLLAEFILKILTLQKNSDDSQIIQKALRLYSTVHQRGNIELALVEFIV